MSDEKKVSQETISKAIESLREISKGHSSRGTATTKVESMRDGSAGAGSGAGSTQVYHTPSNSEPGSWAGSTRMDCPEDGAEDAIEEDGTDYKGRARVLKSIMDKLAKGQTLTVEEHAILKSSVEKAGMAYGMDKDKEDAKKGDMPYDDKDKEDAKKGGMEDKDEEEAKKSLSDHAQDNDKVRPGLEVSEFLANWADVMDKSQRSLEERVVSRVVKALTAEAEADGKFNKSLAEAVANLGEVLSVQSQRIEQLESTPSRGPKSQQVAALDKSFGGPSTGEETLDRAQVQKSMYELVEKGDLKAFEVIRFESTGELSPQVEEKIRAHRNGR